MKVIEENSRRSILASPRIRNSDLIALAVCGLLLFGYAMTAWLAARRESATYDEPVHLVGGYMESAFNDHRLDPPEMQGIYLSPKERDIFAPFMHRKPLAVLGGTIYLFDWPSPPATSADR